MIVFGVFCWLFFFFKQKTAYEMRISDWSSDVCSSDLLADDAVDGAGGHPQRHVAVGVHRAEPLVDPGELDGGCGVHGSAPRRAFTPASLSPGRRRRPCSRAP